MLSDLRYGLRALFRTKGWTAVVVLSLALGIGANAALFSGVHALLLKDLAVDDPQSLVRVRYAFTGSNDMVTGSTDYGRSDAPVGQNIRVSFSYRIFRDLQAANRTFADMFACAPLGDINIVDDGAGEVAKGFIASGNYYRILGVRALLGRAITDEDDKPGAAPVAVISYQYWRSRFGANPNVVGKVVAVRGVAVTIVGVLPREFRGVQRTIDAPPDIAFPLALDRQLNPPTGGGWQRLDHPTQWWLQIMGRLEPGVTPEQAQGNLAGVFQARAKAGLDEYLSLLPEKGRFNSRNRNRTRLPQLLIDSGARGIYGALQADVQSARILAIVVVSVLLIVCANVANLLLARATMREREISVRLSTGATRSRLIRQLLTESVLLALIAGAFGILIAYWSMPLLPGALGAAAALDWQMVGFALAITTATGIGFGIAPALRATRVDISTTLKANSRGVVPSRTLLGKSLVVAQVALSLVLLVGAGLLLRTLHNLRNVDVGFNAENLVVFAIDPALIQHDRARIAPLYDTLMARLRAVPGVRGVTFSQNGLLSGSRSTEDVFVEGQETRGSKSLNGHVVPPNFFETMEIPLVAGRLLSAADNEKAPRVAVVNQTAARMLFPNGHALGRRFGYSVMENSRDIEIVGIVRDARYASVREAPPPTMYVPFAQAIPVRVVFDVRTAGDPAAFIPSIREAVRRVQPDLPLTNVSTQTEQIEGRLEQERQLAQIYAAFAALALVVASVGLFGLISYSVTRRTKEMGIRVAIGAARKDVLWLVMRDSLILIAAGIALGLAGAIAARDLVASLLYGVTATDAVAFFVAIAVMVGVSALAGYLPARRAARVDPMVALRYE